MDAEQRVTVLDGPFKGTMGTVIRDERIADVGRVPCDRVWVLLDVGANPQRYSGKRLGWSA